jgi:integrase
VFALSGRPFDRDLEAVVLDILRFTVEAYNFADTESVDFAGIYELPVAGRTVRWPVDRAFVREYRAHVRETFGPKEVFRRTRILAWLLWGLVRLGHLHTNPIAFVLTATRRRHRARALPKERQVPTVEEAARIRAKLEELSVVERVPWRLLYDFSIETAGRVGEVLGVTPGAVDDEGVLFPDRKNGHAHYVMLTPELMAELGEHLKGVPPGAPSIWLRRGRPITRVAWQEALDWAAAAARVAKRITPHVLRHYHATRRSELGASVFEIQRQLGHKDLGSTLTYIHVPDARLEAVLDSRTAREARRRAALLLASCRP